MRCSDRSVRPVKDKGKDKTHDNARRPQGQSVYDAIACSISKMENDEGWAIRFELALAVQYEFEAIADSGKPVEGFGDEGRLSRLLDMASSAIGYRTMSAEDIQFMRENFGPIEAMGDVPEIRQMINGEIVVTQQPMFSPYGTWVEYTEAAGTRITNIAKSLPPVELAVEMPKAVIAVKEKPEPTVPFAIPLRVDNMEDFADYEGIDPDAYGDFS